MLRIVLNVKQLVSIVFFTFIFTLSILHSSSTLQLSFYRTRLYFLVSSILSIIIFFKAIISSGCSIPDGQINHQAVKKDTD